MISKEEWKEWREFPVTKKLIELINLGKNQAIDDLIIRRDIVGDFERGAIFNSTEILDIIRTGDNMYEGDE